MPKSILKPEYGNIYEHGNTIQGLDRLYFTSVIDPPEVHDIKLKFLMKPDCKEYLID